MLGSEDAQKTQNKRREGTIREWLKEMVRLAVLVCVCVFSHCENLFLLAFIFTSLSSPRVLLALNSFPAFVVKWREWLFLRPSVVVVVVVDGTLPSSLSSSWSPRSFCVTTRLRWCRRRRKSRRTKEEVRMTSFTASFLPSFYPLSFLLLPSSLLSFLLFFTFYLSLSFLQISSPSIQFSFCSSYFYFALSKSFLNSFFV